MRNLMLIYCDLWPKSYKIELVDQSTARDFTAIVLLEPQKHSKNNLEYFQTAPPLHQVNRSASQTANYVASLSHFPGPCWQFSPILKLEKLSRPVLLGFELGMSVFNLPHDFLC